jgi:lysophospholipid acyltransferase (LPLAT)-like uncharacterized protein
VIGPRVAGVLAAAVLLLLAASLRWRVAGAGRIAALLARGEPVVFAFWHGDAPLILLCRALPRASVLVSRSRDGEIATALLVACGQEVVRGSTSSGGGAALRRLLRALREPRRPALAVDGPRGPAGTPGPGSGHLARLGGAWVVPLGAAADGPRLKTWDAARLPWLGARAAVVVGRPLRWAEAPGEDAFRDALQARLDGSRARAARLIGVRS